MTEHRHFDPGAVPGLARRDRRQWFLAVLLGASALGAGSTLQAYYAYRLRGMPADLGEIAAYTLPDWFLWAVLTPLILRLGRLVPLARPRLWRAAAFHLAAGVGVSFAELFISCFLISLAVGLPPGASTLWEYYALVIGFWVVPSFVLYTGILAAGHAYSYYRKYRQAEVRAAELEHRLSRARLRTLTWHLRPHFFFNALHAIGVLVRKGESDRALGLVTGLGDLLRHALEHRDAIVALEEELDFIGRYLEVEAVRYGDRLEVTWDISAEATGARIPSLILQPLVEHAERGGLDGSARRSRLALSARRIQDWLEIEIRATGSRAGSRPPPEAPSAAMEELRARLRAEYGDRHRLVLVAEESGGRVATLRVPYRVASGEPRERPDLRMAGA